MRSYLLVLLILVASPANAEIVEKLDYEYYEAIAKPNKSISSSINATSPIRYNGLVYHGYTKWNISWQFFWNADNQGRCRITSTKITLTGTIQLPKLIGGTSSKRKTFEDYVAKLKNHEWGHYEIGRETAVAIDRELLRMPVAEDCSRLEGKANELANEILEQYKEKERAYDASTGHGKSQGAWLQD